MKLLSILILLGLMQAVGFAEDEGPVMTPVAEDSGAVKGAFSDATGLEVEVDPIEYRTGAEETRTRKDPGVRKHPNVVLKPSVAGTPAGGPSVAEGEKRDDGEAEDRKQGSGSQPAKKSFGDGVGMGSKSSGLGREIQYAEGHAARVEHEHQH